MNMNILHIAGHGLKKNGTFDSGATGFIKQGEHKYYADMFFNSLKKYEPKGHKVVYHTEYNVYNYGNIIELAKKCGKDTIVIEWHFDASSNPDVNKGHVIVYDGFKPDALDLKLRDAIKNVVGVRYSHRGEEGISGRNNIANVNRCAKGGVNYRLIELGFGTSPIDSKVMLEQTDSVAKAMSEAIYGQEIRVNKAEQQQDSMAGYYVIKAGDTLWDIGKQYGATVEELKTWNSLKTDVIFPGQSLEVKGLDLPAPKPESKPKETPVAKPNNEIKVGTWIRVPANTLYATSSSVSPVKSKEQSAQVDKINHSWKNQVRLIKDGSYIGFVRISDITGASSPSTTTATSTTQATSKPKPKVNKIDLNKIAIEVINGEWGTGHARRKALENAGFNYDEVQGIVNEIIYKGQPKKTIKVGSKVKVKKGAKDYNNKSLTSSVYNRIYDVIQIDGNRVVIGKGRAVTAAIHKKDLTIV